MIGIDTGATQKTGLQWLYSIGKETTTFLDWPPIVGISFRNTLAAAIKIKGQ